MSSEKMPKVEDDMSDSNTRDSLISTDSDSQVSHFLSQVTGDLFYLFVLLFC